MGGVLQVLGLVAVTAGAGLLALPAGLIVGGVALLIVGLAFESARKGR